MNVFEEITFDQHYHAYIVSKIYSNKLIKQKDLPNIFPVLSVITDDTHYNATRYGL